MRECQKHFGKHWIHVYMDLMSGLEAPRDFHFWTAVSCICSALGRNSFFDMGGYFTIYPNMYIVLVAKSGMAKSTAADQGIDLFIEAFPDDFILEGKTSANKLLENMASVYEQIGTSRIYIYGSEYRDFIDTLGGNDIIPILTSCFGCNKRYYSDLIKHGKKLVLNNVCINFLACSTPEWLLLKKNQADAVDGGYTARILYIYKDRSEKRITIPTQPQNAALMRECLIKDLHTIRGLSGKFETTPDAHVVHDAWYQDIERNFTATDPRLDGFMGRKQSYTLKTAMALTAAVTDDMKITAKTFTTAIKIIESVEASMPGVYANMGYSKNLDLMDKICSKLGNSQNYTALRSVIVDICSRGRGVTGRDIEESLKTLLAADRIEPVEQTKNGRTALWFKLTDKEISNRRLAPLPKNVIQIGEAHEKIKKESNG